MDRKGWVSIQLNSDLGRHDSVPILKSYSFQPESVTQPASFVFGFFINELLELCIYDILLLDCWDCQEAWDTSDFWWSLWSSCFREKSFCSHGSLWVNYPCHYTWFHIKKMDRSWLAARVACHQWSYWHP